jgi:transcription elongation factor Elf1
MVTSILQNKFRSANRKSVSQRLGVDKQVFGEKVGFIWKLLGCEHKQLSRPFSQNKIAYRSCLECGARRQFDTESLITFGDFYYPPMISAENYKVF